MAESQNEIRDDEPLPPAILTPAQKEAAQEIIAHLNTFVLTGQWSSYCDAAAIFEFLGDSFLGEAHGNPAKTHRPN